VLVPDLEELAIVAIVELNDRIELVPVRVNDSETAVA